MSRVALELTLTCDGRCRFCGQRGLDSGDRPAAEVQAEAGDALKSLFPRLLEDPEQ